MKRWRSFTIAGLVSLAAVAVLAGNSIGSAQHRSPQVVTKVGAKLQTAPTPIESEPAEEAKLGEGGGPGPTTAAPPFRPTISRSVYDAQKAALAKLPNGRKPDSTGGTPLAPPGTVGPNFAGIDNTKACACRPPDTHGAAGKFGYVQVVNSAIVAYDTGGKAKKPSSLNKFFNYNLSLLFDPRVVYDPLWDRFVLTAIGDQESSTVQPLFIAITKTGDPTGAWWTYKVDVSVIDADDFWDYSMLGMDQDAIIITANIFEDCGLVCDFKFGAAFAVAKARLYNGLGWSVPVFTGLVGTTQATIVDKGDQSAETYLLGADEASNKIQIYKGTNLSRGFDAGLTLDSEPAVAAYTMPPGADQPGTGIDLDTLDSRFVNASAQITLGGKEHVYNVHTTNLAGFAAPKWYHFNATDGTLVTQDRFWATASSDDWNASLAANGSGDVFVTWSAVAGSGTTFNPQVRASGARSTDGGDIPTGGTNLFTSPSPYAVAFSTERWGDYSSTTLDPNAAGGCAAQQRAWVTNETVLSGSPTSNKWGSRIARIGFC